MHRILTFILLLLFSVHDASASGDSKIQIFKDAAESLGILAESFEKVVGALDHTIQTSDKGINVVLLRRQRQQLITIYKNTEFLLHSNSWIVYDIKNFKEAGASEETNYKWTALKDSIRTAMVTGSEVLASLRELGNEFVLEESYRELSAKLYERNLILENFLDLSVPESQAEWDALETLAQRWLLAINSMRNANEKMAEYIKSIQK